MIVAGIDPSLTGTGLAIIRNGTPDKPHRIGWPGHSAASDVERNRRVVNLTQDIERWIHTHKPDLIVVESPAYAQNMPSTCDRHGLWHGILSFITNPATHYAYAGVTPTCRAQFAAGNGHASKQTVIHTVNHWWPHLNLRSEPVSRMQDNEADAVVLATMGAAWAGDLLPFELRDYQRNNLEAIAWPVIA
jgi:Holliday junction resolvasome RuvABC endonuclease subunit